MRKLALLLSCTLACLPYAAGDAAARLELSVARAELPGTGLVLEHLWLSCAPLTGAGGVLNCEDGEAAATLRGWGELRGRLRLQYRSAQRWSATIRDIGIPPGTVTLAIEPRGAGFALTARAEHAPLARLLSLAQRLGFASPLTGSGAIDGALSGVFSALGWQMRYDLAASAVTLTEPDGRYASEGLGLQLVGTAGMEHGVVSADATLALSSGQAYAEPIFADFGAHPLRARGSARWSGREQRLELSELAWDQPGVTRGSGTLSATLGAAPALLSANVTLDSAELPAFTQIYLQPFLAGTRAAGLTGSGSLSGSLQLAAGALQRIDAQFERLTLEVPGLESELHDIGGALHWANANASAAPSQLHWQSGRAQSVPLGAAAVAFLAQGRGFRLLEPWRQPILDGALDTQRLALTDIGLPTAGAEFDATVEPIDLAALCKALGWPAFEGKLSGRIPGLSLRNGVVALDGKLEAHAFDGSLSVEGLQLIEPWGVLPRLAATLRLRNLDLLELTRAYSLGRIEGRLDGDVEDLRVLGWKAVAFRARLATPAGDSSRHRISRSAIDNISAVAGGPKGVLSKGFLRVFKDFNYDRIGWSCVLVDGVCAMDGLEAAKGGGYVLVKGRGLPRIDVVGFSHEVNWDQLVEQVQAARGAQATTTRPP